MASDDSAPNPFGPAQNPFDNPSDPAVPNPFEVPSGGAPSGPTGQPRPGRTGRRSLGRSRSEPATASAVPDFGTGFGGPSGSPVAESGYGTGYGGQGVPPAAESDSGPARPPVLWLLAGLAGVLVGALARLAGEWQLHLLGWLIAIAMGLGGVFAFTAADLRLRSSRWYISPQGVVPALRVLVTVGAVVVAGLDAWAFADWLARQDYFA